MSVDGDGSGLDKDFRFFRTDFQDDLEDRDRGSFFFEAHHIFNDNNLDVCNAKT